jgi:hypothetical protein
MPFRSEAVPAGLSVVALPTGSFNAPVNAAVLETLLLSNVSDPASVESVPVVGSVRLVLADVVRVSG